MESVVVDRVSVVATELVSRASGEAIWRFNGEWEIGSVEGVGDGCQVGKGWKFAGGSWGNFVPRNSRKERGFCRNAIGKQSSGFAGKEGGGSVPGGGRRSMDVDESGEEGKRVFFLGFVGGEGRGSVGRN